MPRFDTLIRQVAGPAALTAALRASRGLRQAAAETSTPDFAARQLVRALAGDVDDLARYLLIAPLGPLASPLAADTLAELVGGDHPGVREHAVWALAGQPPVSRAIPALVREIAGGGFGGMLAQMTVEEWSGRAGAPLLDSLRRALERFRRPGARARLVETAGLLLGEAAQRLLIATVRDRDEWPSVRAAAVGGLGRRGLETCLRQLEELGLGSDSGAALAAAEALGELGGAPARRALEAVASNRPAGEDGRVRQVARSALGARTPAPPGGGLRLAQLVLQGRIDGSNHGGGLGDSGGLATLMAGLGRALGRRPDVAHSYLIGRALGGDGVPAALGRLDETLDGSSSLLRIPFGGVGDLGAAEMWPHRVAIERGLERRLRRLAGGVDAMHLRFADAGTLAAWRVCRRAGIRVFFSLAPDPHAVLQAAERSGALDRPGLALADRREHYLFRARLVEDLAEEADGLALFPRPDQNRVLADLVGCDLSDSETDRAVRTVPEGIDLEISRRGADRRAAAANGTASSAILETLEERLRELPPARLGLPLLTAVGRLHPVKGLARLVEAWAGEPRLAERFNLVLAGGDLERPNAVERRVLEEIERCLRHHPRARQGLVLLGHQPNEEVATLLAATRHGFAPEVGAGGIFVCPSDKEEFGLALLEAMAAGLPVVGPDGGGPATYLEEGRNGFLAAPGSMSALRGAVGRAAARRHDEVLMRRARATVAGRFSVDRMAEGLAELYSHRVGRRRPATSA